MKKNKGFIATSLIYSFFLVFIAILTALISSYIANKTILTRFNDDSMDDLNNAAHTVTVYSKNAGIKDGVNLTNLAMDIYSIDIQNIANSGYFTMEEVKNEKIFKKSKHEIGSFITLNANLDKGSTYYFSLEYNDTIGALSSYIKSNSGKMLTLDAIANGPDTYSKYSSILTLENDIENPAQIVIGDSTKSDDKESFIKKIMLINLSQFTQGSPSKDWLDKNLSWFNDNISFRVIEGVKKDEEIKIEFMDNISNEAVVECNTTNAALEGNVLTLKNIEHDVICNVVNK